MTTLKEFEIFEKHFVWTRTYKVNLALIILAGIAFLLSWKLKESSFLGIILFAMLLLYLWAMGTKIFSLYSIKQLKGSFTGNIIFDMNCIQIKDEKIILADIKNIEIKGVDCFGMEIFNFLDGFEYENGLSNGVENFLIIQLMDNKKHKVQFQKKSACELKEIEVVIKHYYNNNKMGYLNCVDILCLENRKEWDEFKSLKTM